VVAGSAALEQGQVRLRLLLLQEWILWISYTGKTNTPKYSFKNFAF
jgi:hypothetical protein